MLPLSGEIFAHGIVGQGGARRARPRLVAMIAFTVGGLTLPFAA